MRIFLRPVNEGDTANLVKWRNSEKVKSHCFTKKNITEESHREFYFANVVTGKYKQFIVERIDEEFGLAAYPIATVYLKDMDYGNKRCELCIFTSNDVEWTDESQSLAIKMLVEKAFQEYGMHKVYSYVFKKYQDEVNLLKKADFNIESILQEEAVDEDGKYEDIIRMSILNKN